MKKIVLSTVAVMAMSTFAIAGGDIAPIEEPIVVAQVAEPVVTDSGAYVGLGYGLLAAEVRSSVILNDSNYDEADLDWGTVMVQAGYKFNSYVAVEARYWNAVSDGDLTLTEHTKHGEVKYTEDDVVGDLGAAAWAVYVKPMYPVTDSFDVYALLGYANTDTDSYRDHDEWDDGAFSWGIGAAYSFTDNLGMFVDYTVLYDDDEDINLNNIETAVESINFGLTYSF